MKPKDTAEKLLEAHNDVFADIINFLLFGGKCRVRESDLEDIDAISQYKIGTWFHALERDVSKCWVDYSPTSTSRGRIRMAFLGAENETEVCRVMPVRVMGYDGAAYRDELNRDKQNKKGQGTDRIYPVVTLVLYFGTKEHWNEKYRSLRGVMDIPDGLEEFVSDYHVNFFEIAWLDDETVSKFQSDFRIVADYFVQMRKNEDYVPSDAQMKHVNEGLNLMTVLTGDQRFEDVQNARVEEEKGAGTMCEVLDRVENRGFEHGMKRGIEQEQRRFILNMHEDGDSDEKIARVIGKSISDVQAVTANSHPVMA